MFVFFTAASFNPERGEKECLGLSEHFSSHFKRLLSSIEWKLELKGRERKGVSEFPIPF